MLRVSEYLNKHESGKIRKEIPYLHYLIIDEGYYLEVYRSLDEEINESMYLYIDIEVTLKEVIDLFKEQWDILEKEIHINIISYHTIEERVEKWCKSSSYTMSTENFTVSISTLLPNKQREYLQSKKDSKFSYYDLEYNLKERSKLSSEDFEELQKHINNYIKFEQYLNNKKEID